MFRTVSPILLCLMLSVIGGDRKAHATDQPNIVFIVSDDQAWTDYGFAGHPQIETPNLDRLAKRSAVFTRGYVPTALCRPSLLTLITGKYAHQHQITGNDPAKMPSLPRRSGQNQEPEQYRQLRSKLIAQLDQPQTLPSRLAQKGYVSFQSGKWWEGSYRHGGFTEGMTRGFPQPGGRHGDDGLVIGREGLQPMFDFVDRAVSDHKPFFLWYAPLLPHTPHNPPKHLFQKYKDKGVSSDHVARYFAMVEWFDETCGQLMTFLDDRKLSDNTLIVYIADNGWIQHPGAAAAAARSKRSPFEGGTRQPIMFCWPNRIQSGFREEQLCSSVDIYPTVLAAAGIPAPGELPGHNLLPSLESGQPVHRQAVFGEAFSHDIHEIGNPEASLLYRWIIVDRWKLILSYSGQKNSTDAVEPQADRTPQLFDLIADPHETQNVAGAHPEMVADLAAKLQNWWPVVGAPRGLKRTKSPD